MSGEKGNRQCRAQRIRTVESKGRRERRRSEREGKNGRAREVVETEGARRGHGGG